MRHFTNERQCKLFLASSARKVSWREHALYSAPTERKDLRKFFRKYKEGAIKILQISLRESGVSSLSESTRSSCFHVSYCRFSAAFRLVSGTGNLPQATLRSTQPFHFCSTWQRQMPRKRKPATRQIWAPFREFWKMCSQVQTACCRWCSKNYMTIIMIIVHTFDMTLLFLRNMSYFYSARNDRGLVTADDEQGAESKNYKPVTKRRQYKRWEKIVENLILSQGTHVHIGLGNSQRKNIWTKGKRA